MKIEKRRGGEFSEKFSIREIKHSKYIVCQSNEKRFKHAVITLKSIVQKKLNFLNLIFILVHKKRKKAL